MKILAVDTSTFAGSVALLDDETVAAEWVLSSAQTHNRRLLKTVDFFLHEAGWNVSQVDGFAVAVGPGSFTGLRIGLTTIKTLAWTLRKPYVGVPALDALAAPLGFASTPVCALMDARKKELYCASYRPDGAGNVHRTGPYEVLGANEIPGRITEPTIFCGDGWVLARELLKEKLAALAVEAPPYFHVIRASVIGELARRKFLAGESEDPMTAAPLYVRPSEAELKNPRLASSNS